jgi:hypothetical protein
MIIGSVTEPLQPPRLDQIGLVSLLVDASVMALEIPVRKIVTRDF